jgi:hypothetical protein
MSATMARQGGRVQLEQADMRIALNMVNMAKHGISRAGIEETKNLIKKPRAEIREEKRRGVELPGHKSVKAVIEKHPSMIYDNHLTGCLICQNKVARNPYTRWRRKGTKPSTTTVPAAARPGPERLAHLSLLNEFTLLEDSEDEAEDDDAYHFCDSSTDGTDESHMHSHLSHEKLLITISQRMAALMKQ